MIRTITTAAELDALPVGSVVLDRWGRAWQKHDPEGRDPLWHAAKHHTRRSTGSSSPHPAARASTAAL